MDSETVIQAHLRHSRIINAKKNALNSFTVILLL